VTQFRLAVLVGTDHHPFDRVVAWADAAVDDLRAAGHDVQLRVQRGSSRRSERGENAQILLPHEMNEWLEWANVAVVHAGPGTIAAARRVGHFPVVVPRDPELGEHVDDHQMRFARWVAGRSLGLLVDRPQDFVPALDSARGHGVDREHMGTDVAQSAIRAGTLLDGSGTQESDSRGRARVVFLGGIGRSGSTLLETLLATTPDVVAVGETVHLWQRGILEDDLCACGEPFLSCPFWTDVGRRAFDGWSSSLARQALVLQAEVDRTRDVPLTYRSPGWGLRSAQARRYSRLYRDIYCAALAVSGADVVVDNSKHVSLAAVLSGDDDIDLRVVQVVRDPQEVADSWSKEVRRPESRSGADMARTSRARIAGRWTVQNALFGLVGRRVPILRVAYEDLVDDPSGVVARVRAFADLPPAAAPVDAAGTFQRPLVHSVSGNPMRFESGPLVVSRRRDDPQRSPADVRVVRLLTAGLQAWYSRGRSGRE
jgi:UDP-N-acetylglucosamine transferase subunit ALG13